jgi:hypothetical protein
MRRTTVGVVVVALALALGGPASACNPTAIVLNPTDPGPGDLVNYSISNLTPGGDYEVSVDGLPVDSGTASGHVVWGSFSMPNLGGSSTDVSVVAVVQHSDIEGSPGGTEEVRVPATISYKAPAPTPAQQSQPLVQGGGQTPATQPAAPQGTASPGTSPNTSPGPLGGGPAAEGLGGAPKPSAPGPPSGPSPAVDAPAVGGAGPASRPGTPTAPAHEAASTLSSARTARTASGRTTPVVPLGPSYVPGVPAAERETARGGDDLPLGLLVAVSALLVAGLTGGWWARVRVRRGGPEPEPEVAGVAIAEEATQVLDAIGVEAELQELIAEELARRMLTPLNPSERADAEREEFVAPP